MPGLQLTRRAPGWNGNIVAGNTVTLRLPIGLTYHQIWTEFAFQDGVPANIVLGSAVDEVRVVANGKPIWNARASEIDTIMQYHGRSAADNAPAPGGIFVIDLDRFNLKTRASQELTALGSGAANDPTPLTTLSIELDIAAGVASGSLDTRIVQSQSSPLGLIKKLRRYVNAFGGAGTFFCVCEYCSDFFVFVFSF